MVVIYIALCVIMKFQGASYSYTDVAVEYFIRINAATAITNKNS